MARTGTTLVSRCINKGKDAYILNETHLIREYQNQLITDEELSGMGPGKIENVINQFITVQRKGIYRKSEYEEYPEAVSSVMTQLGDISEKTFFFLIKALYRHEAELYGKKRSGDQTPNHVFHIELLLSFFPNSVFINMIRDPRAVVLSQKNKWKAGVRKGQPLFEIIRTRINYHPITQSILWHRSVLAALKAIEKFNDKKIINVHYENFVNNPENQLKGICKFADIEYAPAMVNVSVSMSSHILDNHSGIDPTLAEKWKKSLSSTEIFIIELFSKKGARQLGYQLTGLKPNPVALIGYMVLFPIHVFVAFCFNAGRIKNPFSFFKKIFSSS